MAAITESKRPPRARSFVYWAPWTWLVFMPVFFIVTPILSIVALAASFFNPQYLQSVAKIWGLIMCGVNFTWIRLADKQKAVPGKAYVIMCNHQSVIDVLALCARVPIPYRWVMKSEIRKIPLLGLACDRWGCDYIDRKNRAAAIEALEGLGGELLRSGVSVLVYPEGTRPRDGRLGEFKKGGFMLALQLGLPILPMSISGAGRILPTGSVALRPGAIRIRLHDPIETENYSLKNRDALMQEVRKAIARGLRPNEKQSDD